MSLVGDSPSLLPTPDSTTLPPLPLLPTSAQNSLNPSLFLVPLLALLLYRILRPPPPVALHHAPRTVTLKDGRRTLHELAKSVFAESGGFASTPFLFNGHLQTIWASFYSDWAKELVDYERETLPLPDGGTISLDWCPSPPTPETAHIPTVILLHGLTGGSHETYVQDVIFNLRKDGIRAVVCNFRGCAKTELTSSQLYCAAWTDDVKSAVESISARCDGPLVGVGFSLGANIMLKYVGETGKSCPLIGCVSIANPFDLLLGNAALHRTWIGKNVYSHAMARNLARLLERYAPALNTGFPTHRLGTQPANHPKCPPPSVVAKTTFGFSSVSKNGMASLDAIGSSSADRSSVGTDTSQTNWEDEPRR
ncbi:Alpha/Beta hydrolase protein [Blyttiomyces helicus]|uniref:Alpha/Beta hydrolase protein n=1 Tax=Blyttiomyces helicus TaxID=388810 RepID=A0A4P9W0R1_9FUNG|nr:Alpha/Beta hydrolase protein [Blyttiomyces helicus]|eukprot:RKO84703.1 Alpha/Beta hydrolase protein [Blyttiomyces helicus]